MFNDEVASTTSTAPSSVAAISPGAPSPSPHQQRSEQEEVADKPREHLERSLSEDIVSMLDDGGDLVLTPNHARAANNAGHNGPSQAMLPPNGNLNGVLNHSSMHQHHPQLQRHQQQAQQRQHQSQQQSSNHQPVQQQSNQQQQRQPQRQASFEQHQQSPFDQHTNPQFQQFQQMQQMQLQHLQQQLQMQQQLQQMHQQQQRGGGNNWMDSFTSSSSSAMSSGTKSSLENAVAAASSTLTAMPHGSPTLLNGAMNPPSGLQRQSSSGRLASTSLANGLPKPQSTPQQQFNMSSLGYQTTSDGGATPGRKRKAEGDISMGDKLNDRTPETSSSTSGSTSSSTPETASSSGGTPTQQNAGAFTNPAMMMPGFMMYPLQMMGNYNALGMNGMNMNLMQMGAMQMPMGMQMPVGMGMNGLPLGMASPGVAGVNGMQMNMAGVPMGMGMNGGLPMGMQMGMQMPTSMGLPVNPQSGASGDVEMAASPADANTNPTQTPIAMRALQPKDAARAGGPGFVSIARKPEEPEVSSILKSLMEEEAKKKEKKLERNRDSARESRKKQQTYVETLENGIKRLQINRDLVVTYRWGVSGPGFGPLPCPNSPQMFDWKNRVQVVTGQSEAFANIQNPTTFRGLMQLNRQRRALAMRTDDRARAIWKCFVAIGRQLAELRDRIMQVQLMRVFSQNTLAGELSEVLQLSADQKLQLQCIAQTVFNEEVVQMVALFKAFFALRNEAIRLNLMSPELEIYFREACSIDQLHKLLQFSETHRSVIEDAFASA